MAAAEAPTTPMTTSATLPSDADVEADLERECLEYGVLHKPARSAEQKAVPRANVHVGVRTG